MRSWIIGIVSIILILGGCLLLSIAQAPPVRPTDVSQLPLWVVPIAYFTMLIGAGTLAWGLIKRNKT